MSSRGYVESHNDGSDYSHRMRVESQYVVAGEAKRKLSSIWSVSIVNFVVQILLVALFADGAACIALSVVSLSQVFIARQRSRVSLTTQVQLLRGLLLSQMFALILIILNPTYGAILAAPVSFYSGLQSFHLAEAWAANDIKSS